MQIDVEQVKKNREEQKRLQALRLAHFLGMYEHVEEYDKLPVRLQQHFNRLSYADIIVQMVVHDSERGLSLQAIANKYGITKQYVDKLKRSVQPLVDDDFQL